MEEGEVHGHAHLLGQEEPQGVTAKGGEETLPVGLSLRPFAPSHQLAPSLEVTGSEESRRHEGSPLGRKEGFKTLLVGEDRAPIDFLLPAEQVDGVGAPIEPGGDRSFPLLVGERLLQIAKSVLHGVLGNIVPSLRGLQQEVEGVTTSPGVFVGLSGPEGEPSGHGLHRKYPLDPLLDKLGEGCLLEGLRCRNLENLFQVEEGEGSGGRLFKTTVGVLQKVLDEAHLPDEAEGGEAESHPGALSLPPLTAPGEGAGTRFDLDDLPFLHERGRIVHGEVQSLRALDVAAHRVNLEVRPLRRGGTGLQREGDPDVPLPGNRHLFPASTQEGDVSGLGADLQDLRLVGIVEEGHRKVEAVSLKKEPGSRRLQSHFVPNGDKPLGLTEAFPRNGDGHYPQLTLVLGEGKLHPRAPPLESDPPGPESHGLDPLHDRRHPPFRLFGVAGSAAPPLPFGNVRQKHTEHVEGVGLEPSFPEEEVQRGGGGETGDLENPLVHSRQGHLSRRETRRLEGHRQLRSGFDLLGNLQGESHFVLMGLHRERLSPEGAGGVGILGSGALDQEEGEVERGLVHPLLNLQFQGILPPFHVHPLGREEGVRLHRQEGLAREGSPESHLDALPHLGSGFVQHQGEPFGRKVSLLLPVALPPVRREKEVALGPSGRV